MRFPYGLHLNAPSPGARMAVEEHGRQVSLLEGSGESISGDEQGPQLGLVRQNDVIVHLLGAHVGQHAGGQLGGQPIGRAQTATSPLAQHTPRNEDVAHGLQLDVG